MSQVTTFGISLRLTHCAVRHRPNKGPAFGDFGEDLSLLINGSENYSYSNSYDFGGTKLTGTDFYFSVDDIEVFAV